VLKQLAIDVFSNVMILLQEGDLFLAVPRSVMMTTDSAMSSALGNAL
jgi:hypothetical protein